MHLQGWKLGGISAIFSFCKKGISGGISRFCQNRGQDLKKFVNFHKKLRASEKRSINWGKVDNSSVHTEIQARVSVASEDLPTERVQLSQIVYHNKDSLGRSCVHS